MRNDLTQERLKELLSYDPVTGVFIWNVHRHRTQPGDIAGTPQYGYVLIGIEQRKYAAHRLAWLYVKGEWPKGQIDHRNRNRADNRIGNLRLATHSDNMQNALLRKDNTSGMKGVYWVKRRKRWIGVVTARKVVHHLGYFKEFEDAKAAVLESRERLHGDFAAA
jgi:hypothetical protein